ncbi:MAG: hypothetical protein HY726_02150 [Candidatus Rokubacteria bacterium]|nr:hypothetical protein [Candidatus Rokubacteria bacterium]
MTGPSSLERLVCAVSQKLRRRRAEYYALRGAFFGALAACVLLLFKELLGNTAPLLASGLVGLGAAAGAMAGVLLKLPAVDVARLIDRAFGLQDRIATALEWSARADRPSLVDALVADAVARVERLERRGLVPRRWPREARLLPIPVVVALILIAAPPLPLPSGSFPDLSRSGDDTEAAPEQVGQLLTSERPKATRREALQRVEVGERDLVVRQGSAPQNLAGDLSALFKDTSLGGYRPDFASFLKKGDERIRMLEQVDRLPDLQRDFTQNPYKMVFQKMKSLSGGLRPDQLSPEKLRELLSEMERMGRKGGNWGGDAWEGMEALDQGQTDRALEAMERALSKMRSMGERGRGGRVLRGERDDERRGARGRERGGTGAGDLDQDFGEGEGSLPGKGRSASPKGDPSERLRANPYDVGVEGEARSGRKEGFDTNLLGRGANVPSRLQYLGVFSQYRKMMEEALAREQVPRDYQAQVKEYFQALEER